MTTTESIGGECPICGFTRMFMRYGSSGWFQFDACPKCGFAYGENDKQFNAKEVWESLIKEHKELLIKNKFPINRRGLYKLVMSFMPPFDTSRKTVFIYTKEYLEQFNPREKVMFT